MQSNVGKKARAKESMKRTAIVDSMSRVSSLMKCVLPFFEKKHCQRGQVDRGSRIEDGVNDN